MRENFNLKQNKKKGFTVIELVVVIVLMSILALIFIPNLTAYGSKADDSKILANMKGVHTSAELVKQTDQKLDKDKIAKLSNNDNISLEIVKDLDRVYDIYYVEQQSDTIVVKYLDRNNKLHVFPKELANYTISFDTDGGNSIPEITQIYGSKITKPEDPKKKGEVFEGWKPSVPSKMPMENVTIKAKWSTQRVTAIFNPNKGVVSPEFITVDYGENITLPTPTRLLYVFTGWYTSLEDGSKVTSIESLENDVTLYARWRIDNIITKVKPAGTTSKTQTHKIPLDGVKNVDSVKVISPNGGTATVVSIDENEITVRVTGANTHNRSVQTGGVYTPIATKTITDTRKSSGSNTNPNSISYDSDGYSGTLTKGETKTDKVQTGGSYIPADSKNATDSRTSYGSNNNPGSVSYSSEGYVGNLTQSNTSTGTYQTGGSYTSEQSQYVSGQTSSYYNSGGYSGYLSSYVYSGDYTSAQSKTAYGSASGSMQYRAIWNGSSLGPDTMYASPGMPFAASQSYNSGGFSGTLYKSGSQYSTGQDRYNYDRVAPSSPAYSTVYYTQNYSGTVTKPASDTRVWRYSGYVTKPASDTRTYGTYYTASYSGTVTKPAVDTRTWETSYTSDYSGIVSKPATDTRTYDNFYDYELEIDYNKGY